MNEPDTLSSILLEMKRFGCECYCGKQLETLIREVLGTKRRKLVIEHGKGNRPQAARELTEAEDVKLFEAVHW